VRGEGTDGQESGQRREGDADLLGNGQSGEDHDVVLLEEPKAVSGLIPPPVLSLRLNRAQNSSPRVDDVEREESSFFTLAS
jgi:hypothetical protein